MYSSINIILLWMNSNLIISVNAHTYTEIYYTRIHLLSYIADILACVYEIQRCPFKFAMIITLISMREPFLLNNEGTTALLE